MKILVHWHVVSSYIAKYFLIYDVRRHIDIFTIFISDQYLSPSSICNPIQGKIILTSKFIHSCTTLFAEKEIIKVCIGNKG